jgi:hypothetical protein
MSSGQTDDSLESTDSDGDRDLGLVGLGSLLSKSSVDLSGIFNTVSMELWGLLRFDKGNIFLKEVSCQNLSSSAGSQLLFVYASSLSVLFLFSLDFSFDDSIIIRETESRGTSTRHHESMVTNNLLSDTSIVLGVLLVKHDKD